MKNRDELWKNRNTVLEWRDEIPAVFRNCLHFHRMGPLKLTPVWGSLLPQCLKAARELSRALNTDVCFEWSHTSGGVYTFLVSRDSDLRQLLTKFDAADDAKTLEREGKQNE